MSEIKVKLIKSRIGTTPAQKKVLDAMGLRRREMVKTLKDNAATRGMIASVSHLVEVIA
ncbi:50S ribosomal protein L30 [uncultured Mailhella sp.]|uniref:50S ribosomal protein L30 n=1 Tax=uncultured Mailhella sp. TaxID=1981031 RepID=UPI0025CFECF7|nr:50S ribosomal protein L30 [uncultured Mailhella sp.]